MDVDKAQQELDELKKLEQDLQSGQIDEDYGMPDFETKDGIFNFFRKILTVKDTTRVGNLREHEINMIRADRQVAVLANALGSPKVSAYLNSRSNKISEVSMSRKGFWPKLFVTQIKKTQNVVQDQKGSGGLFSKFGKSNNDSGDQNE